MATRRRGLPRIEVDERTKDMTLDALQCRRLRHAWQDRPQGKTRRSRLRLQGLTEEIAMCLRCGLTRVHTVDLDTWEVVARRYQGGYPKGYEVPRGSGRLSQAEVRKAWVSRVGFS